MKLSNKECAIFLKELGSVLNSGLSSNEAMAVIAEDLENKQFRDRLMIAKEALDSGDKLSAALKKCECFDDYLVRMIDIGENTGYLDKSINELSKYYARLDNSADKLKEALYYPSFILLMMIVVMVVIVIKVLPVFEEVLNNMGTGLNTNALMLMKAGMWLADYGLIIIAGVVVIVLVYVLYMKNKYHDDAFREMLIHNPITGRLAKEMDVSSFVFGLSLLVNSGYEEAESLAMLRELTRDEKIKTKIDEISGYVNDGDSLSDAICKVHILKSVYERMIRIGYKSGSFEKTMNDVAHQYENEVDHSVNRFLGIIEPAIIILCSLIVGVILLSVMLPLLSIMSSI